MPTNNTIKEQNLRNSNN